MFWDGARSRTGRVPEQFCVPEQSKRFWNADLFQNGSVPEHPLFWNAPAVPERGGDVPDGRGLEGKARPPPSVELDPARVIQFYIPYIIEDRENQKKSSR